MLLEARKRLIDNQMTDFISAERYALEEEVAGIARSFSSRGLFRSTMNYQAVVGVRWRHVRKILEKRLALEIETPSGPSRNLQHDLESILMAEAAYQVEKLAEYAKRIGSSDLVQQIPHPLADLSEWIKQQADSVDIGYAIWWRNKSVLRSSEVKSEISPGLEMFYADHGKDRTAFIMMQFTNSKTHDEIVRVLKAKLAEFNIIALRADDKQYMDDLFPNIKVYMHGCEFGIAVYERIMAEDFNPNVSLEVGYMLGLGKNVLLLKDRTLRALPTDLTGRLYRAFDTRDVETTLPQEVTKWLVDKGMIRQAPS